MIPRPSLPYTSFVSPVESGLAASVARVPMADEPSHSRDFATLYRATLDPLRRYLARLLGNSTEAQDVAHDAYMRVYPTLEQQPTERPEALLYLTARRLAINRLKRRELAEIAHDGAELDATAAPDSDPARLAMARQELALLETAIAELPEGCRTVLLLRKVELLSHREIADRLGITVSTVEKQHARALRLLRAALPAPTGSDAFPAASAPTQEVRP
ncbi:MAG: sigma-70 family RNA polymerase sigma factor [Opitutae bacterium]|nr:sigma-70 family RNA polymerase sigma factor [Opitutae bacterium]